MLQWFLLAMHLLLCTTCHELLATNMCSADCVLTKMWCDVVTGLGLCMTVAPRRPTLF